MSLLGRIRHVSQVHRKIRKGQNFRSQKQDGYCKVLSILLSHLLSHFTDNFSRWVRKDECYQPQMLILIVYIAHLRKDFTWYYFSHMLIPWAKTSSGGPPSGSEILLPPETIWCEAEKVLQRQASRYIKKCMLYQAFYFFLNGFLCIGFIYLSLNCRLSITRCNKAVSI